MRLPRQRKCSEPSINCHATTYHQHCELQGKPVWGLRSLNAYS